MASATLTVDGEELFCALVAWLGTL